MLGGTSSERSATFDPGLNTQVALESYLTQVPGVTAASPAGAAFSPSTDDGLTVVDTINYAGQ